MPASACSSSTPDPEGGTAPRWVSVHLYHHNPHDELLRSAVRPLVDELANAGLSEGSFFIRYWQGGPHVRLRVLLTEGTEPGTAANVIERHIRDYFARGPSQTAVRPDSYQRAAGGLARHEFGSNATTIEPLQPNNSLRWVDYVSETDRLGGPAGVAAFEPHFIDSSSLALEVITADPDGRRRVATALTMTLVAGAVLIPHPQRLARFFHHTYRSWGRPDRHPGREARFERLYLRQRPQLDDVVHRVLDECPMDATLARWAESLAVLRDRLAGRHLKIESALFQCAHKHNNRLGIGTTEETYLHYLLQRTLTDVVGGKDSP